MNEYFQLVNIAGDEPDQKRYPDVAVTRKATPASASTQVVSTSRTLEPILLTRRMTWDEDTAVWLEIQTGDGDLVTVVELLSPANKTGDGYRKYVERREGFLSRSVNLVELDLLLRGRRLPFDSPLPAGDHFVFVTRGESPTVTSAYQWKLEDALPVVPVPLRAPDADIDLDLSEVFATSYERGRYERRLKYQSPESSGLEGERLAWAKSLLWDFARRGRLNARSAAVSSRL